MRPRVSFEQSLEHCLQELTRTGDVEASLRRYPQYADRLRPLLEMAQETRRHYESVPEAPGGLAAGREWLLAVAAQQRAECVSATSATRTTTGRPQGRKLSLVFSIKFVAVLLAVVLVTAALGGGVIWAASDSLPGDLLYPVKLVTEDVRLALVSAPGAKVDLALGFVEERAGEVKALAVAGRRVPDEAIARMERHIERALATAGAAGEEREDLLVQIAERTRTQGQVLEGVSVTALPARLGLERAVTVCQQGAKAAEAALNEPQPGPPEPTREPKQPTATPGSGQGQGGEREGTPVGTPHVTPHGPGATPSSQPTPQGPRATGVPQPTPQGLGATAEPQPTPQGPGATAAPQPTSQGPGATPTSRGAPHGP
jgi:hypothetical protein